MTVKELTRGRYNPDGKFNEWTPLGLILLRTELEAGAVRMSWRWNKTPTRPRRSVKTRRSWWRHCAAVLALHDMETQRDRANHNSILEKVAHARTVATLEAVEERSKQLQPKANGYEAAVADLMSKT